MQKWFAGVLRHTAEENVGDCKNTKCFLSAEHPNIYYLFAIFGNDLPDSTQTSILQLL